MTDSVLIAGAGIAGLAAAVAAADRGAEVAIWTKVHPLSSHSVAATGGINAALGPGDSWLAHAEDTLAAAAGLADRDAVELVCSRAADEVRRLESWGVPFNRDADGALGVRSLSGGSQARTVFAGGTTGKAVVEALWQRASRLGVRIHDSIFLSRLVVHDGRCVGAAGWDVDTGEVITAPGPVVLATGGMGRLYRPTTNSAINTGDGLAVALRHGIPLRDLEMTQFYPTAFVPSGVCVTEEVRVRGAVLVNTGGERFMSRYDPARMEMANRDVLSRAVFAEEQQGRSVQLDCRSIGDSLEDPDLIAFTSLTRDLTGLDPRRAPIPVTAAFHFEMGGVGTGLDARTPLPGVLAAGECACVSVHGGNRIGANSLLETLVMGRVAGRSAAEDAREASAPPEAFAAARADVGAELTERLARPGPGTEGADLQDHLTDTMSRQVGLVREGKGLDSARADLEVTVKEASRCSTGYASRRHNRALRRLFELEGMLDVARALTLAAAARTESRGAHFRADAEPGDGVARHSEVRLDDDRLEASFVAVRD